MALLVAACVGDEFAPAAVANTDASVDADAALPPGDSSVGPTTDSAAPDAPLGNDAAPDADAAAWTPMNLPGLALWLDGTQGTTFDVNAKLSSWIDRSGNANNATITPPCVGPARAASSLNGHDTLAFSGSGGTGACITVQDSASLQFGTTDFAFFLVARYTNVPSAVGGTTATANFWKKYLAETTPPFSFAGVHAFGNNFSDAKLQLWQNNLSGNQAVSATAGLNDNAFRRLGGTRRGLDMETWINGASDAKTTLSVATDVSAVGQPLYIGGDAVAATGWMAGNIAEIVAVKGTLTNAQIALLDGYLKTKHGL